MVSSAEHQLTVVFIDAARNELRGAAEQIAHCVNQLTDEQIWARRMEQMNAVGNLILHLCGNLRQWVVHGVGGAPDVRDRPAEFARRQVLPRAQLLEMLKTTVAEADDALARCDSANLVRERHVQIGPHTGAAAIFHSVSHFVGHTQEITYIARLALGGAYQFRRSY